MHWDLRSCTRVQAEPELLHIGTDALGTEIFQHGILFQFGISFYAKKFQLGIFSEPLIEIQKKSRCFLTQST